MSLPALPPGWAMSKPLNHPVTHKPARVAYIPEEDGPPEVAIMGSGETDEEAIGAAEAAAWRAEGRAAQ